MAKRRLLCKTTPSQIQDPVPTFGLGNEAPTDSKLMAYLITFSHPKQAQASTGVPLVPSSNFSKEELVQKVLDCFANPEFRNPSVALGGGVAVRRLGVWREWHAEKLSGQRLQHDHVPTLCFNSFRYLPIKRALLTRHGLASHWSQHTGYWSMVRYVAVASPSKPSKSLDPRPALWDLSGAHPPIVDCCYEPLTAKALDAKRRKLVNKACETGGKEPRVTDLDIWALVIRANIRNTHDNRKAHLRLAAYAKQHCGEAVVNYLFKRRSQLPSMIDDFWLWENAEAAAAAAERTRVECVKTAATTPCVCSGEWLYFVDYSLRQNGIDIADLCESVWAALREGRAETSPVVVFAGLSGGEGNSLCQITQFCIVRFTCQFPCHPPNGPPCQTRVSRIGFNNKIFEWGHRIPNSGLPLAWVPSSTARSKSLYCLFGIPFTVILSWGGISPSKVSLPLSRDLPASSLATGTFSMCPRSQATSLCSTFRMPRLRALTITASILRYCRTRQRACGSMAVTFQSADRKTSRGSVATSTTKGRLRFL